MDIYPIIPNRNLYLPDAIIEKTISDFEKERLTSNGLPGKGVFDQKMSVRPTTMTVVTNEVHEQDEGIGLDGEQMVFDFQ